MKLSLAILVAAASATEKKVPPRHPLQRLNRLVEFTEEILTDWFDFLPSQQSWIEKFKTNAERMRRNFERGNQRCGFYEEGQLPHGGPRDRRDVDEIRYNRKDPKEGVKQLTTGFRKWAERYISQCSGQKNNQFQVNRMEKWNSALQGHLKANYKKNCPDLSHSIGGPIFGGLDVATPTYLSVPEFRRCFGRKENQFCEPAEKPKTCPDDSWEQLYGYCGVADFPDC